MKYLIMSDEEHNGLKASIDQVLEMQKEILLQKRKAQFLSNNDLVRQFQISKRTAQNWRDRGILEFIKIGDRIYYEPEAIDRMLKNHRIKSFISR